jgi:hypothetical protein
MIETAAILYTLAGVLMVEYVIRAGWRPNPRYTAITTYITGFIMVAIWPVALAYAVAYSVRGVMRG